MIFKRAHCLFEQSGTFKKEFIKLGFESYDYDIQNEFGETDFVIDLFQEIEKAFDNKKAFLIISKMISFSHFFHVPVLSV